MSKPRYSVVIQWSDEDDCYVVSLPEWGTGCKTHGDTYEEAARNAQEVLELLMEPEPGLATERPTPKLFHYPGADVVDVADQGPQPTTVSDANPVPVRQTA